MLKVLHTGSTPLDQPYCIDQLHEYPNNAGLADYTSTKQLVGLFNDLIKNNKTIMVLGFHQETAVNYLGRLEAAVPQMEAAAKAANVQLEWAKY